MSKQTIRRAPHDKENPYKMLRRATMEDDRLSFEARGALAYILVKPDDWTIQVADLQQAGNIGRDQAYRILNELIECGYCTRTVERERNEWGQLVSSPVTYTVSEEPHTESRDTESRDAGFQDAGNTTLNKEEVKAVTKKEVKAFTKKEKSATATPHADPLKDLPAIQVYRDTHNRYPQTAQMKLIQAAGITDLVLWKKALDYCAGKGWNPLNIQCVLDMYQHPDRMTVHTGGTGSNGKSYQFGLLKKGEEDKRIYGYKPEDHQRNKDGSPILNEAELAIQQQIRALKRANAEGAAAAN